MSLTQKVAFNTIFQIVGKIIATFISLITIGYLTRYLGVAGYGTYTTIFAYVSFWGVIADFGFFWVLVRELSKPQAEQNRIFNNLLTFKIIFGLLVFIICSIVGFFIPQYSWTTKIGITIIATSWFWMSLNSTYVGLFQSRLTMYKSAITELAGRAIILAGVIFSVVHHASFQGILEIYIVGNLVNFLLSFFWGSREIKFKLAVDWDLWKMILRESFPLAMLSFIGLIHFKIDTIILSILKNSTDVGIYGVPYKILEIVILVPSIFVGNVFPVINNYYHNKDARLSGAIQKSFNLLIMLALPITVGLILLATPIISLIGGSAYLTISTVSIGGVAFGAPQVLMILAVALGIIFVPHIFSALITVMGKQTKQVMPMVIITITNIVLNIIFIPRYSYVAAAIITVITEAMVLFWWYAICKKYLSFRLNFKILPKTLLATLIMAVFLYLGKGISLFVMVPLAMIIYFAVGYGVKMFDANTIRQMVASNKKVEG